VLRSSASGSSCWDIFPRLTGVEQRAAGLTGPGHLRRAKLTSLARRRSAPGLLAYRGGEAVGWISVGPRLDYHRIARSRATPPVDEELVWVIPCITVRREARGQGVAIGLIRAAVDYARTRGGAGRRGLSARRCEARERRVGVLRDRGALQEGWLQEGARHAPDPEGLDATGHDALARHRVTRL